MRADLKGVRYMAVCRSVVTIYCLTVPVAILNGKSPRDFKLEQLKTVVGRMAC